MKMAQNSFHQESPDAQKGTEMDQMLIDANEAGFEAGYNLASARDNPHEEGTAEHDAWEAGRLQSLDTQREVRAAGLI